MKKEKKKGNYATRIVSAIFELKHALNFNVIRIKASVHRILSDVINPMNEKGSHKEKRNVSEGRDRRSRNGKNQRVCRGCEEAGDSRMIALGVQKK